jgi:hypothetical protein
MKIHELLIKQQQQHFMHFLFTKNFAIISILILFSPPPFLINGKIYLVEQEWLMRKKTLNLKLVLKNEFFFDF